MFRARDRRLRALFLAGALVLMALSVLAAGRPLPSERRGATASRLVEGLRGLAPETPPEMLVRGALRRVERAGSYRLRADAEQLLLPRGLPGQRGQRESRSDLRIEAAIAAPERSRIELAVEGGGGSGTGPAVITMLREGGRSFVEAEGRIRPVSGPAVANLPSSDPLVFLAASRAHRMLEGTLEGGPADGLTRIGFEVDGPAFARRMSQELQSSLRRTPPAPLAPSPKLSALHGQGEVWIDERGLPVRMLLDLEMPELDEAHDGRSHLIADFQGFGEEIALRPVEDDGQGGYRYGQWPSLSAPSVSSPGAWLGPASALGAGLALAGLVVLAAWLWIAAPGRRRKGVYAAVAGAAILSQLLGPGVSALQGRAFASELRAATEQGGLAEALGGGRPAPLRAALAPRGPAQSSVPPEEIERCGQGSTTVDSDGEGLSDYVEGCLGTDPLNVDTDGDLLNDRLEIDGIEDANGKRWTSDPLRADSNGDGLTDKEEWPWTQGYAPSLDPDGDGLPNVWDPDNDGDGVEDGIDIAPFSYTDHRESFELNTFRPSAGLTDTEHSQIVFIHVQPEDEAHLRYSLTPLDWSYDDLGQIKVLGQKARELKLSPMLAIDTSISPTQATDYGVTVQENEEGADYPYTLLMPLSPLGRGGRIEAFGGTLAYAPEEIDELVWQARMIWTFTGVVDTGVSCDKKGQNCWNFDSKQSTLVVYPEESFRISGLSVQLSSDTKLAALATPDRKDEDYDLIQAFAGLNETFLRSALPDVDPDAPDYSSIDGALGTLTGGAPEDRFGITSAIAAVGGGVQRYDSAPEGWQRFGGEVEGFLNAGYERCLDQAAGCRTDTPALLLLSESDSGVYTLDDMAEDAAAEGAPIPTRLPGLDAIDIDDIPVATLRGTRIAMYAWRANRWAALTLGELMEVQEARYPDLDPDALSLMRLSYAAWSAGIQVPVATDGVPLDDVDQRYQDVIASISGNAVAGRELGEWFTNLSTIAKWSLGKAPLAINARALTAYGLEVTFGLVGAVTGLVAAVLTVMDLGRDGDELSKAIFGASVTAQVFAVLEKLSGLAKMAFEQVSAHARLAAEVALANGAQLPASYLAVGDSFAGAAGGALAEMGAATKLAETVAKIGKYMPEIAVAIGVIIALVQYFYTLSQNWSSGLLWILASAELVASIVLVVALYFIAAIPGVGTLIVLLFLLISALIWLFSLLVDAEQPKDLIRWVTIWLADHVAQAAQVTDVGSASFGDMRSELSDESAGPVEGNTLRVWTNFEGRIVSKRSSVNFWILFNKIKIYYKGGERQIRKSHVHTSWVAEGPGGAVGDPGVDAIPIAQSDRPEGWATRGCQYLTQEEQNRCRNGVGYDFFLRERGANRRLKVLTLADVKLAFRTVVVDGLIPFVHVYESGTSPDPEAEDGNFEEAWRHDAFELYFDVLPPSLDELWTWSDTEPLVSNRDRDADGVENEAERDVGTDWELWDTDGDGLSDGFELDGQRVLSGTLRGADPLLASTDGDGLDDRLELLHSGTAVDDPDSDEDGLLDHEEVCVGGEPAWTVRVLTKTMNVCANPNDPDPDGDGLSDEQERAAGTSPYAYDEETPIVLLEAAPYLEGPAGQAGTYLRSGQDALVTMTVRNVVANQAGEDVSLCLDPSLGDLQALLNPADETLSADCELPSGGTGTRLRWSAPRLEGAELQAAFRARVTASRSMTAPVHLALPFRNLDLDPPVEDATLRRTLVLRIDQDKPELRMEAPSLGDRPDAGLPEALSGERYVLGGSAWDESSWIEGVELRVRDASNKLRARWSLTESARSGHWSAAWELPEDGSYTIRAWAKDAVARQSPRVDRPVIVDNTAPLVALDLPDGALLEGLTPGQGGRVTATLPIRAQDAHSGIDRLLLSLDGRPYRKVALPEGEPYPQQLELALPWSVPGARAQGEHRVGLLAFDRAGNASPEVYRTVLLDLVAPLSLPSSLPAAAEAGAPLTVLGHADDTAGLPPPAHAASFDGPRDALDDATVWAALPGRIDARTARWIGDFDADGRADLALGLPEHDADGDGRAEGQVRILLGRAGGWASPPEAERVDEEGPAFLGSAGAGLGYRINAAGDVDGDGADDVLVADARRDRVFLVFGRTGTPASPIELVGASPSRSLFEGAPDGELGLQVAPAGDVNADGQADLLLVEGGARPRAHLILGDSDLRGRVLPIAEVSARSFPLPSGEAPAIGAGDLDGDGYDDLAIADPAGETGPSGGQAVIQLVRGTRYVTLGTPVSISLRGAAPLGDPLAAAGDLDGDGYDDLAFGSGEGAQLALGGEDLGALRIRSLGVGAQDLAYLAGVGDLDPDGAAGAQPGLDDLVVGTKQSEALVLLGETPFRDRPEPAARIARVHAVAPSPFAGGSDANCDGSAELLAVPLFNAQPAIDGTQDAGAIIGQGPGQTAGRDTGRIAARSAGSPAPSDAETRSRQMAQAEGEARVSPRYCASCENDGLAWQQQAFDSISSALATGARRLHLDRGVYEESLRLGDEVQLLGVGAAHTVLRAPAGLGEDEAVVRIEGDGVRLSGLAIVGRTEAEGQAAVDGLYVASGEGHRLHRLILREARRALVLDGAETGAEIDRVTVLGSQDGIVSLRCAPLDLRNAILAYHAGRGLVLESNGCPAAGHRVRYTGFWGNGRDVERDGAAASPADLGLGQVPADPRFVDPSTQDFRLQAGSPMIDAGQPGDAFPPGAGPRVDLGYAERGAASAYAGAGYCPTCDNDGLAWGVDAFATIAEALEAAQRQRSTGPCSQGLASDDLCGEVAVVRVGPGLYEERLEPPSGIRLLGAGADATILDAGYAPGETGSAILLEDRRRVEISGFTVRGFGTTAGSAGLRLAGATSAITLGRNLIVGRFLESSGASAGVLLQDRSSAQLVKNTIVKVSQGVAVAGAGASALIDSNLVADYQTGIQLQSGGRARSRYNFLHSTVQGAQDYAFVGVQLISEGTDVTGHNPDFTDVGSAPYHLRPTSRALEIANPAISSGLSQGGRASAGYWDRLVSPFVLHFGQEGARSCQDAASGVDSVRLGLGLLSAPSQTLEAGLPTDWIDASLDPVGERGRAWSAALDLPEEEGLYRVYARSRDAAGNESIQLLAELLADGSPPLLEWQAGGEALGGDVASVRVMATVTDVVEAAGRPEWAVDRIGFLVDPGDEAERFVAGTWLDEPWSLRDGRPRRFFADVPLAEGAQDLVAVARNRAGLEARTGARRAEASGRDRVSLIAPRDGQTFRGDEMLLRGFARLADAAERELRVYAGDSLIASAELPGTGTLAAFELPVDLPAGPRHELRAVAGGAARNEVAAVTITRDEVPPELTLSPTAEPEIVTLLASLAGQARDESGPPVVEVSFDGGASWAATVLEEEDEQEVRWSLDWLPPGGSDGETVAAWVRARDEAGNETIDVHDMVVDNTPPEDPSLLSVSPPEGSYVERAFALLELVWRNPVMDGSGPATVDAALAMDDPDLPPPGEWSSAQAGCNTQGSEWTCLFRQPVSQRGTYTLHLRIGDPAGNDRYVAAGPFHVGQEPPVEAPDPPRPSAPGLRLELLAEQGSLVPKGPGDRLGYRLRIHNDDPEPRSGARLLLEASEGGELLGQQGARCELCPAAGRAWELALDEIPARGDTEVELEVGIAEDLGALDELALQVRLRADGDLLDEALGRQPLDAAPPRVRITGPLGGTGRPGGVRVSGRSDDEGGIGVERIELRQLPDGPWWPAEGTRRWSSLVELPAEGVLRYEARATDRKGRSRVSAPFTVTVDSVPPEAWVEGPERAESAQVLVQGVARDPAPAGGLLRRVQLRIGGGPWRDATIRGRRGDGFAWQLLLNAAAMDIGLYELRVRAQDAAGTWSEPSAPWDLALEHAERADLVLEQRLLSGPARAGEPFTVELRSRSLGPREAEDVVLLSGVPRGTELVSAPSSCARLGPVLRCAIGSLAPGEERALVLSFHQRQEIRARWLRHYASLRSSSLPDPDRRNDRRALLIPTGQAWERPIYLPVVGSVN